ncbi:hypothetical protein IMG5_175670 [Ichthyophthirius multifiliis]|uniref:Uncharacterized protein n=1 Tax=Ichthyophthirius multifiliis TaxID=5932 RepID=G0R274_ICHMU|nr:hypothetical protein IMG5_175670 [Ichthyophthirius multifiliis]EGR28429.1 hypothetical protein IMG5_175670 [Ichthyophthirius multifiliis]|eukprot:XP_004029665.1 hypothetical protein IMG5_175670 [Ichthyophthirius multifiliis]
MDFLQTLKEQMLLYHLQICQIIKDQLIQLGDFVNKLIALFQKLQKIQDQEIKYIIVVEGNVIRDFYQIMVLLLKIMRLMKFQYIFFFVQKKKNLQKDKNFI